jgi:hypothetical protein
VSTDATILDTDATTMGNKELVTSMQAHENVLMALMPISVVASQYLVMTAKGNGELYSAVSLVSGFYMSWALLNKFTTKPYEKGHIPLGICLAGCLLKSQEGLTSFLHDRSGYLAVLGAAGTWLAFAIAGFQLVFPWPVSKTAYVSKKTLLWAHILRLYFAASLCMWAYFTFRLVKAL